MKDLQPHPIRVEGGGFHEAWFYRLGKSAHVVVRPLSADGKPLLSEPISFRLTAAQILGANFAPKMRPKKQTARR